MYREGETVLFLSEEGELWDAKPSQSVNWGRRLAHLILDFITRTILGEEYKSFSSLLYSLLHSPVTSSLLGPNVLLNSLTQLYLMVEVYIEYTT